MAAHIINPHAIILIINNIRYRVEKSDNRYATIIKKLDASDEELLHILENRKVKDDAVKAGFVITDNEVTYKGEKLPDVLAKKIRSIYNEGLPLSLFEKFWENLNQNPSRNSVEQLYDFLSYRELPICETGEFIAYKGVTMDYWSIKGNTETIVEQGRANSKGQIYNGIGEKIRIKRNRMSEDRGVSCDASSTHIGSLEYAKDWASSHNGRVVIVKANPADVVSVPTDCQAQKCRVSAYEVIGDYVEEIMVPVLDEEHQPILSKDHVERKAVTKERSKAVERVENYIRSKNEQGYDTLTIRQIQSIFSPNWPTKQEILDILQELEYSWNGDIVQIQGFDQYVDDEKRWYYNSADWYDDGYGEDHDA
jgi:hypothetical protein